MYSIDSRVRYSEVDYKQDMTFTALLNYFQDCCTFQSEDLGIGVDYLSETQTAWMLISWQVVLVRKPRMAEQIRVNTWPYDFGGFYGYRNFTITDEAGEVVAYANSVWVYMDLANGRPCKLSQKILDAYEKEPKYPMDYAKRKMTMPADAAEQQAFTVHSSQIDTNHHVNNEKYVEIAHEYLPKDFVVGQMRAEYKKSAVLGDTIIPCVSVEETGAQVTVALVDENRKPYAVVEFSRR